MKSGIITVPFTSFPGGNLPHISSLGPMPHFA